MAVLPLEAPWATSRRIVCAFPICSPAKLIGLIYAAAESSSDGPAWLGVEQSKNARMEIVPPVHVSDEWHLQHFCSKCLIPDRGVVSHIPQIYLGEQSLLQPRIKTGLFVWVKNALKTERFPFVLRFFLSGTSLDLLCKKAAFDLWLLLHLLPKS